MSKEKWFAIDASNEGKYDTIRRVSMVGVQALYNISAADKALAVPRIEIWEVDRNTNKRVSGSITNQFYEPPQFGKTLGSKFGERPDVSIENIQVKNHMPQGWIQWRDITINIMVHRPDALNDINNRNKVLGALFTPGRVFLLNYGWIGGNNPILGPGGTEVYHKIPSGKSDSRGSPASKTGETVNPNPWGFSMNDLLPQITQARENIGVQKPYGDDETQKFQSVFKAVDSIRFAVTHYNFSVLPDGQIRATIHAKEDGVLNTVSATIFDQDDVKEIIKKDSNDPSKMMQSRPMSRQSQNNTNSKPLSGLLEDIMEYFKTKIKMGSIERSYYVPKDLSQYKKDREAGNTFNYANLERTTSRFIELQLLFNILLAEPMVESLNNLGYTNVQLSMGVFQNSLCSTSIMYDGGFDYSGKSIGNFFIRTDDVEKIVGDIIANGGQITINNILERFRAYLEDPGIWDLRKDKSNKIVTSVPEMQIFAYFDPVNRFARIQLSDRKRYLTILTPVEFTQWNYNIMKDKFRENLSHNLSQNFIPYLTLFHQKSFFQDAKFEIVQDERMRSLFIQSRNQLSRTNLVKGENPASVSTDQGVISPLVLYKSAIKGNVTMLGNFIFSYAGLVWINFGVPAIDGLFYVMQKVDEIGGNGFTSTYTFQAEGSNPLNAQPGPGETAEDWVRQRILLEEAFHNFTSPAVSKLTDKMMSEDTSLNRSFIPGSPGNTSNSFQEFLDSVLKSNKN